MELTPFKGHAYSIQRGKARRPSGERYLLVGDAAGLAQDFSGEGIGPAVRSACMASDIVLDWLEGHSRLEAYSRHLAEVYGRNEEGFVDKVVELLPGPLIRSIAKLMCGNAWLRRRIVLEGAFGIG